MKAAQILTGALIFGALAWVKLAPTPNRNAHANPTATVAPAKDYWAWGYASGGEIGAAWAGRGGAVPTEHDLNGAARQTRAGLALGANHIGERFEDGFKSGFRDAYRERTKKAF